MRTYRKLGLAEKLMTMSRKFLNFTNREYDNFHVLTLEQAMADSYGARYVTLHVRKSNVAAVHLYTTTLGFRYNFSSESELIILIAVCSLGGPELKKNIMLMEKMHSPCEKTCNRGMKRYYYKAMLLVIYQGNRKWYIPVILLQFNL